MVETYVDYSFDPHPLLADIWKAGHSGTARYFHDLDPVKYPDRGKKLTRDEALAVIAAGKKLFVFYENGTEDVAQGFQKGVDNAKKALAYRDKIGAPAHMTIVMTADHGYTWLQVKDYFAGARSVLGSICGVYGGEAVAQGAVDEGYPVVIQAYAWSRGDGITNASARKVAGIHGFQNLKMNRYVARCDEIEIYKPIPSWGDLVVTPPTPKPVPKVVDLNLLISASNQDAARPQGGTTPGAAPSVKIVEDALVREGLLNGKFADGSWGTLTTNAYAALQRHLGYSGKDADGKPGLASLTGLGKKYGFSVGQAVPGTPTPAAKRYNPSRVFKVGTPFGKPGSWAAGYHTGVDFLAPYNSVVVSSYDGVVVGVGQIYGAAYGRHQVVIEHTWEGKKVRSLYAHMIATVVSVGQQVNGGQHIGNSGGKAGVAETGNSSGPHLHYEERVAPYGYMDHIRPVLLPPSVGKYWV